MPALPLDLAVHVGDPDVGDLGLEERLDRLLDLGLRRVAVDLEDERLLRLLEEGGLLGQQGPPDDVVEVLHRLLPPLRREPLLELVEGFLGDHEVLAVHDVVRGQVGVRDHLDSGQVPARQHERVGGLVVDHHRPPGDAQPGEEALQDLRLRRLHREALDDLQRALDEPLGERGTERRRPGLLGHRVRVVPGLGAEHGSAVAPQRVAGLAGPRPPRCPSVARASCRSPKRAPGSSSCGCRGARRRGAA